VTAKLFGTYVFPRNLGLSQGKILCSLGKVPFSLRNLGLPQRKLIAPQGKKFIKEVFLLHWELAWDSHLIFFSPRKLL
jgi:hypothetical protein